MAKPTIKTTKNKNTMKLTASGELNAQHAQELKTKYLDILEATGDVHIALDEVTTFDVAAVQLTYLLKTEIEKSGRKITITLPQQKDLITLLEKSSVNKIL